MFVSFEQMKPVFRNYRRSPYLRILLIVVSVHMLLFVLTPPFQFKPYSLEAADTTDIIDFTVVRPEPPPPIPPELALPMDPEPWDNPDIPDIDPGVTSPLYHEGFPGIPDRKPSPPPMFVEWDKDPEVKHLERPEYPDLARQAGIEGIVRVLVTIGIDGKVYNARVMSSDVTESMTRAALIAARKCTFKPAEQQGKKVRVTVMIPFEFRLTNCR